MKKKVMASKKKKKEPARKSAKKKKKPTEDVEIQVPGPVSDRVMETLTAITELGQEDLNKLFEIIEMIVEYPMPTPAGFIEINEQSKALDVKFEQLEKINSEPDKILAYVPEVHLTLGFLSPAFIRISELPAKMRLQFQTWITLNRVKPWGKGTYRYEDFKFWFDNELNGV